MAHSYTNRKLTAAYPTDLKAWQALQEHHREAMQGKSLRELFAADKDRAGKFSIKSGDLLLDYSKIHVDDTTLELLTQLASEADVPGAIDAMFAGEKINATEDRSVLHVALIFSPANIASIAPGTSASLASCVSSSKVVSST